MFIHTYAFSYVGAFRIRHDNEHRKRKVKKIMN